MNCRRCGGPMWLTFVGRVYGTMAMLYQYVRLLGCQPRYQRCNAAVCDVCQRVEAIDAELNKEPTT